MHLIATLFKKLRRELLKKRKNLVFLTLDFNFAYIKQSFRV